MKTIIVHLKDSEDKANLSKYGEIGSPKSIHDVVLLKTDETVDFIKSLEFVEDAFDDESCTPEEVQTNTPSWYLPAISGTNNGYHYDKTGKDVNIYVVDSGIRFDHTEFRDIQVNSLYSFDDNEWSEEGVSPHHGTACASCAAGRQYGTAKQPTLYNARTNFYTSDIIKALDTILDHFKNGDKNGVVSMSFSSKNKTASRVFDTLKEAGMVLVACAGNEGEPEPRYPAKYDSVVGVGALTRSNTRTSFTNGKREGNTIWAPGQSGKAADPRTNTANRTFSGTSASCPLVSGVFSMALEGKRKLQSTEDVDLTINHVLGQAKDIGFGKMVTNNVGDFDLPEIEQPEPPKEPTNPEKPTPEPPKKKDDSGDNKAPLIIAAVVIIGSAIWYFTK